MAVKKKIQHKAMVITVQGYETLRWYWKCSCGRKGRRNRDKSAVVLGAKYHEAHKLIRSPGWRTA